MPDARVQPPPHLLRHHRQAPHRPQRPRRHPRGFPGPLDAPRAREVRERLGAFEEVGARHEVLAHTLLQRREQLPDLIELVAQVLGGAGERTAGVHDGEREIVPDVRVDAAQRELHGTYAAPVAGVQERSPAGGGAPAPLEGLDGVQVPLGEEHVERHGGPPVGESAPVHEVPDLLRDARVDPVEDRDAVPLRPPGPEPPYPGEDTVHSRVDAARGAAEHFGRLRGVAHGSRLAALACGACRRAGHVPASGDTGDGARRGRRTRGRETGEAPGGTEGALRGARDGTGGAGPRPAARRPACPAGAGPRAGPRRRCAARWSPPPPASPSRAA
ncbi:hypothetical protein STTU_5896 [Streptomyces sp. Tu6071]|nr:hypothetical protein STTU_5896 [Streptomyces sp. Tu6071]